MDIDERFWNKVDIKDLNTCWNWQACRSSNGYGSFWYEYKNIGAHVVAWCLSNNRDIHEILGDRKSIICHKCDNPSCCNPNHLYLGTYSDNRQDAGRRNPIPPSVAGSSKARFHEGEIWLIRKLRIIKSKNVQTTYKFSAHNVAKMFRTTHSVIFNIWNSNRYLCKEGYYI